MNILIISILIIFIIYSCIRQQYMIESFKDSPMQPGFSIPIPSFETNKIAKDAKPIDTKMKKKIITKKIVTRNISNSKICKFFSSSGSNFTCPPEYPVFTGASLSVKGESISCNGDNTKSKRTTAIGSIKQGRLDEIVITNKGLGYTTPPKVNVIGGNGVGASAYALVKTGSVYKIIVTNQGSGYTSTPSIKISKPNVVNTCNLCCKNEL
jgi:hypothetical protein